MSRLTCPAKDTQASLGTLELYRAERAEREIRTFAVVDFVEEARKEAAMRNLQFLFPQAAAERLKSGLIRNKLLASLSLDTLEQLRPKISAVTLPSRRILHERNLPIKFVYFLESGWASVFASFADGFQVGTGLVGYEGMTGICLLGGSDSEITDAVMQAQGNAFAIEAGEFRNALELLPEFKRLLQVYSESLRTDATLAAACIGHHSLEQRLARWLLMIDDRNEGSELAVTQEFLAMLLCVHRPSVTVVAGRLQRAGLIRYAVRQVTILDRPALSRVACECYAKRPTFR